jgi:PPOX class probable F420-dependent enzyme
MDAQRIGRLAAQQEVAELATIDTDRLPHLVPICFAFVEDCLVTAIDQKPKSTVRLTRLANIGVNPEVAVLFHHYEDDWDRLWWVRANGMARVEDSGADREAALEALEKKYEQYQRDPPRGPAIIVTVDRWQAWAATGLN